MLKTVIFWLEFTLSFQKNIADQTWKAFNTKFGTHWKDQESSTWVRQILALFCILLALILDWNCVKGLRVIKIVKQIKFEGIWGKLEAKNCSFYVKQCTKGKIQFLFFSSLLPMLTKFSFWEEDWALGYNSMKI